MMFNRVAPILLATIFTLFIGYIVSSNLEKGGSLHYDEFYSLERSHGFDKFGDWFSVYSENEPSAKKPPLQYWLNGLSMKFGLSDILALRLWSAVFFVGLLVVCGWTSFYLKQDNPWVIPATILLAGSSVQLVELARSGLLDVGMGFFLMTSLLTFFAARTRPQLWLLCGLMVGLGSLQKAPVALLFIAILLYVLKKKGDPDYQWSILRQNRYFNRGLWTAVGLFLIWPIVQSFKYGSGYINVAIKKQMLNRFSPLREEAESHSGALEWMDWLWNDLHWLAIVAGICVVAAVVFPRWRKDNATFAYALICCLIILGFTLASGKIYSRYLGILTPILICVTVKVIADLVSWKPGIFIVSLPFFALSYNNIQQTIHDEGENTYVFYRDRVAYLDHFRNDTDFVVINRRLIPPGAYGYFGKSTIPFRAYDSIKAHEKRKMLEDLAEMRGGEAIVGFDRLESRTQIEQKFPGIEELDNDGEFFVWRYRPPVKPRPAD